MNITRNSWHYKVYAWFMGYEPSVANLCPYVRAVFLWAPLKFVFANGFIWKIPVAAITYPLLLLEIPRWAGMVSYDLKMFLYTLEIIAVCAVLVLAVLWLWTEIAKLKSPAYYVKAVISGVQHTEPVTTITTVLNAYWKAVHDKVCPMLSFDEEAK